MIALGVFCAIVVSGIAFLIYALINIQLDLKRKPKWIPQAHDTSKSRWD
jgi:hypothetical protein